MPTTYQYSTTSAINYNHILQYIRNCYNFEHEGVCIYESGIDFIFGGCAAIAFAEAFEITEEECKDVYYAIGLPSDLCGLTHHECYKVISYIGEYLLGKRIKYTPNYPKSRIWEFAKVFKKGVYICSMNEHLSVVRNGSIYDTYYRFDKEIFLKSKLIGWWKIK